MGVLKPLFVRQKSKAATKAAFAGHFAQAFAILETGGDINATRYIGDPEYGGGEGNIGYAAIMHGNKAALEKALDKGLDPGLQSPYRSPLVIFAIQQKQEDMAKLLVERGADVASYQWQEMLSPLSLAKIYQMDALATLIESKLTPDEREASLAADFPWGKPKPPAYQPRKWLNL